MEMIKIVILLFSSLLLIFVGFMRLSNPTKTYLKNSGIVLSDDVNLLNEMRGQSSVMLLAGIVVALGMLMPVLTPYSFLVGALIFIGFVVGRLVSTFLDGKPNKQINQGIIFEIVLGLANVFGLIQTMF